MMHPDTSENLEGLTGKVVWVSGAAQGLGLKICERLSLSGCVGIIMTDIWDVDSGKRVASEVSRRGKGCNVRYYRVDVRNSGQITRSMRDGKRQLRRLDAVVNCAGINHESDADATLSVNAIGTIRVNECAFEVFGKNEKGEMKTILNVSSASGLFPLPFGGEYYAASKHAVVGYSKSIAPVALENGVRVMCFCPGWIDIGMGVEALQRRKDMVERSKLKFLMVDEVTETVLTLLRSNAFAGEVIYMSGGIKPRLTRVKLSAYVDQSLRKAKL